MNIFIREFKSNFKSLLIWSGIIVFIIYAGVAEYVAFSSSPEILNMLDSMPTALLDTFNLNAFNLSTVTGYFGVMFTYFALLGSVFAVLLGSDIIAKEERDKTVEFSLTLPLPRYKFITWKILAAIFNCLLFALVMWGASILLTNPHNPEPTFAKFLQLCISAVFILQMIFLSIGVLLGCAMKKYKQASAVSVSILMGTYFLSILSSLGDKLEDLKYFSPFTYFDPVRYLTDPSLDMPYVYGSITIIVVSFVIGYITYAKRDLYI